jgi:general secretion pathway protein G
MKRQTPGFTLIELLVVIAIIAVLAAVVFPVFVRARDSARQTECINNLRQLGISVKLYGDDYDDRFPLAVDFTDQPLSAAIWAGYGIPHAVENIARLEDTNDPIDGDSNGGRIDHILRPYIRDEHVFRCPGDTGFGGIGGAAYTGPFILYNLEPIVPLWQETRYYSARNKRPHSYWGGTSYLYRTELGMWMKPSVDLRSPSDTNVLFDGAHYWHTRLHRKPIFSPGDPNLDLADATKGSITTLMADGSARPLTWADNVRVWSTRHYRASDGHIVETLWKEDIDITEMQAQGW